MEQTVIDSLANYAEMEIRMDIDHIRRVEYNQQYILGMRPVFNHRALFSDTTENYISPAEPKSGESVKIRFRTARNNVDRVFLVQKEEKTLMSVAESDAYFDYYEIECQLGARKSLPIISR